MYLFSWDNVPGKDNGRLLEYLEQKYGAVYQFLTLRDTISVLKIHEEEMQSARDKAQEGRIASLEGTRAGATTSLGPRVAALEPQLASLDARVAALERVPSLRPQLLTLDIVEVA